MNRLGIHTLRELNQVTTTEIAVRRRRRSNVECLIGLQDVRRESVGPGVHRDRPDPALTGAPDDANGDLAAIGDEDGADQWGPVPESGGRGSGKREPEA